jgi:hypothetical protein
VQKSSVGEYVEQSRDKVGRDIKGMLTGGQKRMEILLHEPPWWKHQ